MSEQLSTLISNILDIDEQEVKEVIPQMSLHDLVGITDAIRNNNQEQVFEIYNGYLV